MLGWFLLLIGLALVVVAFLPWAHDGPPGGPEQSNLGFGITPRKMLNGPFTAGIGVLVAILGGLRAFLRGAQPVRHWVIPILSLVAGLAVTGLAYQNYADIDSWTALDSYTNPPTVHHHGIGLIATFILGGATVLVALLALAKRR